MPGAPQQRFAFTIIELMVVVGIIFAMLGLLMPAVAMVRETANRTRCENNLHQIGLAIHHYDSLYRSLPRAFGSIPDHVTGPAPHSAVMGSLFFVLLPMMGEQPLFDSAYSSEHGGWHSYMLVRDREVKAYVCPSDPTNNRPGLGNYIANESVFTRSAKPKYRLEAFPDGASHTILISERVSRFLDERTEKEHSIQWAGEGAYYTTHGLPPIRVRGLMAGGGYSANTAHSTQPVVNGDGSIRRVPLPANHTKWIRASLPDDGLGWEF